MKSTIENVTELNLKDIPETCNRCLYWSFPEESAKTKSKISNTEQESIAKKRQWILQTLREFGNCSKILYHGNMPVGYVEYAPSNRFPQIEEYKSQPIGRIDEGVVFLSCLCIVDENFRGKGLGEKLLSNVIADLRARGLKVTETYARKGSPNNPSGPIELYLKTGFYVKDNTNPGFPIARLDL